MTEMQAPGLANALSWGDGVMNEIISMALGYSTHVLLIGLLIN